MSLSDSLGGLFAKPYEEVRALEARSRMDTGAILVDVREPAEWAPGHAEGARHIPLAQLGQRQRELPAGRPVITLCRSGARSARAATLLAAATRPTSMVACGPGPPLACRLSLRVAVPEQSSDSPAVLTIRWVAPRGRYHPSFSPDRHEKRNRSLP